MMDSTRPRCFRTSSPAIQSKCVIEHYKYNITKGRFKATDTGKLRAEYSRLVEGLAQRGNLSSGDTWLSNLALPDDILKEAVAGNIRRAEHFLSVLRRLVQYIKGRLQTDNFKKESPVSFVASLHAQAGLDQKTLKFCYDRLHSLMLTLEITDTDEFSISRSFTMSLTRECICPMVLTRGSYQLPVSTKYDMRSDPGVGRNYGRLFLRQLFIYGCHCLYLE
ncbi:hypothetical protein BVRB_1g022310 isoform C [Beta vulgaris subsp. vulgaris]|nr:hypothetical protein BVRB_1g022310 isoform C [Beta vulgaris subsp. vulgaris]